MTKAMRVFGLLFATTCVIGLCAQPALAQKKQQPSEDMQQLRKEVEALKEGQEAIQKDLQDIKRLLQARPAAPAAPAAPASPIESVSVDVAIDGSPFKGEKNAPVTLVEFSEYQCPFCARHAKTVMPDIVKTYVDTGKLKYVFRDFPLDFHKLAPKAAEASHCAGEQGKYWEMHDHLFENMRALNPEDLVSHATTLGLDVDKFKACLDGDKYAEKVRRDFTDGNRAGVRGTPSFLLGLTEAGSSNIKAVKLIRGARGFDTFKEAIDDLLAEKK